MRISKFRFSCNSADPMIFERMSVWSPTCISVYLYLHIHIASYLSITLLLPTDDYVAIAPEHKRGWQHKRNKRPAAHDDDADSEPTVPLEDELSAPGTPGTPTPAVEFHEDAQAALAFPKFTARRSR